MRSKLIELLKSIAVFALLYSIFYAVLIIGLAIS